MAALHRADPKLELCDTVVIDCSKPFKFLKVQASEPKSAVLLQSAVFDPSMSLDGVFSEVYSLTIDEATTLANQLSRAVAILSVK